MNLPDFIIIYLACGAPLGVYYFLQNRHRVETRVLFLKAVFRFVFWIPFAVHLVARKSLFTKLYNNTFDANSISDAKKDSALGEIKKFFESRFSERRFPISIFEFREIFDRYLGLSLEIQNAPAEIAESEHEIFRITNHTNKKIAEICLNRRNRRRLDFHQKLARRDFLEIFELILKQTAEPQALLYQALELADLVGDSEGRQKLTGLAEKTLQTPAGSDVRNWENELWKPDQHKPLTDSQISTNLRIMTATAKLSRKD